MEKRMREVRDKASRMSHPLFPRVHVNDTEKGGRSRPLPGAPIALYQQSSVRSPTNISDYPSTLSISLDTTSFSRGVSVAGKDEKNLFIPFRGIVAPSTFTNKQNSLSQSVGKSSVTVDSLDSKGTKSSNRGSMASVTKPNVSEKEFRFKNFSFKNVSCLDYPKAPVIGCSETGLHCEDDPPARTDLSLQLHTGSQNMVESDAVIERSREYLRSQCEDNTTMQSPKSETAHQRDQTVGVHNCDDASESSGMDSVSDLSVSPNHVVKMIHEGRCSKMRSAMIDQQRIFATQVFELHRLITVQKTLARSPNTLLEGHCNTGKPVATAKLSFEPQMAPKVTSDAKELKPAARFVEKCIIPKLPLPSLSKEVAPKQFHPAAATSGRPSSPMWFSAPGNQWLVPVVSPSEGLVYKPYAGPCPPTSSFTLPMFGNDTFETALRFPAPHKLSHSYFPPYVTPRPMRCKPDVLPLFPTEPTCPESKTDEHKQNPPLHAIKVVPHNPTSASESAARILRIIQEERKQ